jgi:hypothetical protein
MANMRISISRLLPMYAFYVSCAYGALNNAHLHSNSVEPFVIDLSTGVPRLRELVENTKLPDAPEYAHLADTAGIDLEVLNSMRTQWLSTFDWQKEQEELNR